jgi:hypothetical protein
MQEVEWSASTGSTMTGLDDRRDLMDSHNGDTIWRHGDIDDRSGKGYVDDGSAVNDSDTATEK